MYFTIDAAQPSSSTQDAWRSFNDLRGHARVLGTISASFRAEAAEVTSAYGAALSQGGPERWSRFVSAAFALGRHGAELESLIGLAAPSSLAISGSGSLSITNSSRDTSFIL